MVLLLGLCTITVECRETSERMIEAVKEFLEKMWNCRSKGFWSDTEPPVTSKSRSRWRQGRRSLRKALPPGSTDYCCPSHKCFHIDFDGK
ncbi:hypothetical protein E2C01_020196 [Portunus trituberculatus]|uniref:Uncharacterized protein n=1 Tax=Portunus trituberculatus TaxID=210409 RepID=A0A5B7E2I3_PORTR|nr:hypothetical protein [Portunus trituberculatus]